MNSLGATLDNTGILENQLRGIVNNYGTLHNRSDAITSNAGTLNNRESLNSYGSLKTSGAIKYNGPINLFPNSIFKFIEGNVTIESSIVFKDAGERTIIVGLDSANQIISQTISIDISEDGESSILVKTGVGKLALTDTNTHTGGNKINEGVLSVSAEANLGDSPSNLVLNGGVL